LHGLFARFFAQIKYEFEVDINPDKTDTIILFLLIKVESVEKTNQESALKGPQQ